MTLELPSERVAVQLQLRGGARLIARTDRHDARKEVSLELLVRLVQPYAALDQALDERPHLLAQVPGGAHAVGSPGVSVGIVVSTAFGAIASAFPVSNSCASRYLSLVPHTTSSGSPGAGGVRSQSRVLR